jgi:glutamyl-tRNA synthetase
LDYADERLGTMDYKQLSLVFHDLNHHLTLKSFLVDYSVRLADLAIWGALKANPLFGKQLKSGKIEFVHLTRWYNYIAALDFVQDALQSLELERNNANKVNIALFMFKEQKRSRFFGHWFEKC